jgi:hypothetical protein
VSIAIQNEPCNCPPGECAAGVERDDQCINRHSAAITEWCASCGATTWHEYGTCLRCGEKKVAA